MITIDFTTACEQRKTANQTGKPNKTPTITSRNQVKHSRKCQTGVTFVWVANIPLPMNESDW
jgi:hypothetical protein